MPKNIPRGRQAQTKANAEAAFEFFVETYGVKYDKAIAKLVRDREVQLAFYDFPAKHWKHIRTWNPIESAFAPVRHPCGIASARQRVACAGRPASPWSSSS